MKIVRPATIADTGSFTRATTGTYFDSTGTLQTAAINTPRFNYNPANLSAGPTLLIEAAATNLLLNSATVVTQSITPAAGTYTLSFFGTGSITLSGGTTGTLVGTGASTRVTLTFVASGASITFTITGSCTNGQVELGSVATSYIATVGTSVTRAADVNTAVLVSNVPENDFPVWNSGTTYAVGDTVLFLSNHKVYQSSVAGNVNHTPPNTAFWIEVGSDNRWRMFDQSVTSQTSVANSVIVAITPGVRIDSIIALNCSAATITINGVDPVFGNFYSRKISMTSFSGINDWYEYFYEPILQVIDTALTDIPVAYSTATFTISINTPSGNPAIGGLILGLSKEIGTSEIGAKVGTIDYSVKTKDAFGNLVITPRSFSKRADFNVYVPTENVDDVSNLLTTYRTVPVVYIGSNVNSQLQFTSTLIYGFYKDASITINPTLSLLALQIEGLT